MKKLPFRLHINGTGKHSLRPASQWAEEKLRSRNYKDGDIVFAIISKPRNPRFNSLVHAGLGRLLVENVEGFKYLTAHDALKRLQIEAGIGCKEMGLNLPGVGPVIYKVPESLSFESMSQDKFSHVFKQFCRYVAEKYFPDLDEEGVQRLSEVMENE